MVSNCEWLVPDLMDVVRLFDGAEKLEIGHEFYEEGFAFVNIFRFGVQEWTEREVPDGEERLFVKREALIKRYSKLALYHMLSKLFSRELPWGSLTGIRPVALARKEMRASGAFEPLLKKLCVSEPNIALVKRVIGTQEEMKGEHGEDVFVSLPFCPTKCAYCSFITAPIAATEAYLPAYLSALERELAAAEPLLHGPRSFYIGGGTPFVLSEEHLERVLAAIAPLRQNGCEYTVEAGRPDTFTEQKLELCKTYGVTRICINAQSFSDDTLRAIGRKHTASEVYRAFEMAAPYGFDVNCDLIAGLADETPETFAHSVDEAIALSPANITVHTLCLKKGARLKEEMLREEGSDHMRLREEGIAEMIAYSREALTAAGYEPYYLYRQKYMAGAHENVGWTKKGKACIYNVDVMEETEDNLAVGANAITKRVFREEERIERCAAPKDIPTYIAKVEKIIEEKNKLFGRE